MKDQKKYHRISFLIGKKALFSKFAGGAKESPYATN